MAVQLKLLISGFSMTASGIMNLSVLDTGGDILAISQFTLHAKTKKGNRPSYIRAAQPEVAKPVYEKFVKKLSELSGQRGQNRRIRCNDAGGAG